MAWRYNRQDRGRIGGTINRAEIKKPPTLLARQQAAARVSYTYRLMRAFVRYYLNYTPEVLDKMTTQQLAEAFSDVMYVRNEEKKYNQAIIAASR